jgi:hypothetical protein
MGNESGPPSTKRATLAPPERRSDSLALPERRPDSLVPPQRRPESLAPPERRPESLAPPARRPESLSAPRRSSIPASSLEPKVKGVAFRTVDLCFERLRGTDARDRAREHMPVELADAFRYYTVLASSWYPISWYRETFRAFRASTAEGPELAREIGKLAARHDMSGVHKQIFAKFISPQALLSMSQRVFNTYYDTGRFEITTSEPFHVQARCANCVGWDHNMWMELAGSCASLLEIAGARSVELQILSGGLDGVPHATLEARWK